MPKGRRSDYAYQRNASSTQSLKPLPRRMQAGLEEADDVCKAYELQGRSDAALVLTEDIHRCFPDYLFARVTLAAVRAKEGRTVEAAALLDPLLTREEFHISEYAALCLAQVELALARNQPEVARSLVDMLADVAPDYPSTAMLRARLTPPKVSASKLLRKSFGGLWKK